jgi:hypothetical protein
LIRPKSDSTSRYFDHRSGRAVQAPLTHAFTPLGATSGVDRSRQPQSPRLVFALDDPLARSRFTTHPKLPSTRRARSGKPVRGSTRHEDAHSNVAQYRSAATDVSEPKPTGDRRVCRADKPSEKSRSSHRPHPGRTQIGRSRSKAKPQPPPRSHRRTGATERR